MLIFKTKTNIFKYLTLFSVFLVLITVISFSTPNRALATDQTITLERVGCDINGQTNKWSWGFKITTSNVPNNTQIYAYLKQGTTATKTETLSVKDNYAQFLTGPILEPSTTYSVAVVVVGIPKLAASFAETTPAASATTCTNLTPITATFTTPSINTDTTYTFLQPLPGFEKTIDTDPTKNACPFGDYLNLLIKLFLGVCGVLAVIMIVMGGIEYMTSELISSKEAGKETIRNALLGLLLALGAYLILNTINPDLLSVCLNKLPSVSITVSPYEQAGLDVGGTKSPSSGKWCGSYADGADWKTVAGAAASLPSGITTNANDCSKVGQTGRCTSTDGLAQVAISGLAKLKTDSKCNDIIVTGGTECWLHGGPSGSPTIHKPGDVNGTVDLAKNSCLTAYIQKAQPTPVSWISGRKYNQYVVNGVTFVDEPETNHFHVRKWQ